MTGCAQAQHWPEDPAHCVPSNFWGPCSTDLERCQGLEKNQKLCCPQGRAWVTPANREALVPRSPGAWSLQWVKGPEEEMQTTASPHSMHPESARGTSGHH